MSAVVLPAFATEAVLPLPVAMIRIRLPAARRPDPLRRELIRGALACTGLLLQGCVTDLLWKERSYSENVTSILISQDGQYLVFIGKAHHYIFAAPPALVATLGAPFRPSVEARLSTFRVDREEVITGKVSLDVDAKLPEQHRAAVAGLGYVQPREGAAWQLQLELVGQRYPNGDLKLDAAASSTDLRESLYVQINEAHSTGAIAGKVLLTPITEVTDGALFIAAVPLTLVFMTVMGVNCSIDSKCMQ